MRPAATLHTAQQLLSRQYGGAVQLALVDTLLHYEEHRLVLRCALTERPATAPAMVVIKHVLQEKEALRHEWAALTFLGQIAAVQPLMAPLLAAGEGGALLVVADLGPRESQLLGNILTGTNADQAEAALMAAQKVMAALHIAVPGPDGRFTAAQEAIGATAANRSRHRAHHIPAALTDFATHVTRFDIQLPTGYAGEIENALSQLQNPGPFLTFTHGDMTPSNIYYRAGQAWLFDWEAAAFRHALIDGAFAHMRYLYTVWGLSIPRRVQDDMFTTYRTALAAHVTAAADDTLFFPAYTAAAAGWMAGLCQFLPRVMEENKRWGRSTLRQRIVAGLDHLPFVPHISDYFPALQETAQQLATQLRRVWPAEDCILPLYGAWEEQ